MKKIVSITLFVLLIVQSMYAYTLKATVEQGFLGVFSHRAQFSNSGTYFDYKEEGGQDVLFHFMRIGLEFELNPKYSFFLLYQPLTIESEEVIKRDVIVDDEVFTAGTPMKFLYNFPFYRFSYLRTLVDKEHFDFALGLSLQIRNATIDFASLDGEQLRSIRDVGPVPALKLRTRFYPTKNTFLGFEADGMYAPVSYLNGSDEEIVGAILDASIFSGVKISEPGSIFLNMRYLGGGAVGTDSDDPGPGDGYVKNWLHFYTVSVGFSYSFSWEGSK